MIVHSERTFRNAAMALVVAAALLAGSPPLPDPGLVSRQPVVVTLERAAPARPRRRRHYPARIR